MWNLAVNLRRRHRSWWSTRTGDWTAHNVSPKLQDWRTPLRSRWTLKNNKFIESSYMYMKVQWRHSAPWVKVNQHTQASSARGLLQFWSHDGFQLQYPHLYASSSNTLSSDFCVATGFTFPDDIAHELPDEQIILDFVLTIFFVNVTCKGEPDW